MLESIKIIGARFSSWIRALLGLCRGSGLRPNVDFLLLICNSLVLHLLKVLDCGSLVRCHFAASTRPGVVVVDTILELRRRVVTICGPFLSVGKFVTLGATSENG